VKNSALFGVAVSGSIFMTLITLFLTGRAAFEAAAALLVFAAAKFFLSPNIRRQEFKRTTQDTNPGASYNHGAAMHALLVSTYIIAASIGSSFFVVGAEKAGSFIALACGVCIASLCFSDEKSLFASALFSNKKLLGWAFGAFWAFALIGYLLLETGAAYPFLALAAAIGVFPFSEIVKLVFRAEKREKES
jgi:hypothetical protein